MTELDVDAVRSGVRLVGIANAAEERRIGKTGQDVDFESKVAILQSRRRLTKKNFDGFGRIGSWYLHIRPRKRFREMIDLVLSKERGVKKID